MSPPNRWPDALREDTALVSVMLVNNETGCVFPAADIALPCCGRRAPCPAPLRRGAGLSEGPLRPGRLGCRPDEPVRPQDRRAKGVGALYIGPRVRNPHPLLPGGGQERGARSGTEATAQIAGFAKAVELRLADYDAKLAHMAGLKAYCREKLLAMGGVVPVGEGTAPHILAVSLARVSQCQHRNGPGAQGICISAGSACHRGRRAMWSPLWGWTKDCRRRDPASPSPPTIHGGRGCPVPGAARPPGQPLPHAVIYARGAGTTIF